MAATLVAGTDVVFATATEGNVLGIPTVADEARCPMLGYGLFLLAVAVWALSTSYRSRPARPGPKPRPMDETRVLATLRALDWYVADDVRLPHITIDHVAVGPAGVLAIQTMRTDQQDGRSRPGARARLGAQQLRKLFAVKEIDVEVVPALLAFGPGQADMPSGVKVVDSVAVLFADHADRWIEELTQRHLLSSQRVDAARAVLADLLEGDLAPAPVLDAATA